MGIANLLFWLLRSLLLFQLSVALLRYFLSKNLMFLKCKDKCGSWAGFFLIDLSWNSRLAETEWLDCDRTLYHCYLSLFVQSIMNTNTVIQLVLLIDCADYQWKLGLRKIYQLQTPRKMEWKCLKYDVPHRTQLVGLANTIFQATGHQNKSMEALRAFYSLDTNKSHVLFDVFDNFDGFNMVVLRCSRTTRC